VIRFDPGKDSEILPRVADEGEATEERIAQTLRVPGMKRSAAIDGAPQADVELLDDEGNHILIDIKVRERDPKQRDIELARQRLTEAARIGQTLEVWHFNVERLKLVVMSLDRSGLRFDELIPLNVWEKTSEGVFDRSRVVEEVEDWVHRVGALYEDVRAWLGDRPDLRCEQSRSVIMSEEMMQQFAVPDRDIPVLDILDVDQVIASFVPRGLWMIGSWGRIDIITRDRTRVLVALGGMGSLEWRLVSPEDRQRMVPFDNEALLALIPPALIPDPSAGVGPVV
jgi:hypothetical protein